MKAWVLSWNYGPFEGPSKIVRVYLDEQRARDDYALVEDEQDRRWELDEVPAIGQRQKGKDSE
jgi:hypothetical protein